MKWNEYNAAVSASNESARADSHHRAGPEPPETENKKPNRTRNNKITVYLSDAELSRLNAMVDKTIMNREQFIRKMIEGKTITEAPPAPLLQTVRMMKDAQFNIRRISEYALLSRPIDEELLRKTLEDINTCVQEVMASACRWKKGEPIRMKSDRIDLGLTGYDELFMSTEERLDAKKPKVDELPLDKLKPFKNHPFKVMEDEEMERLKESIRVSGVLIPALARPTEDGYELISGHRRLAACRALGMGTMPVIVRNLTDEEAIIAMVDSNLQREHILPSEKAFAYKMKLEAMKHQGKRTSDQLGQKFSVETIADNSPDSKSQVQRYIRLTNLIPDILKLVDEGRIALTPAVELSYLNSHEQNALYQIMACDELTPSLSQAQRLRKLSEDYTLTDSGISQIMSEIKGNQKEYLKIEVAPLRRYFPPGTTAKQMQTTMLRAMEFYRQHTQNRADKPKEREER